WLEEHGYIRRVVVKGRGQKIVVPNWDKYQDGTSSETELTPELAPELTPELADGTSSESELAAELAPELAAELKQEDQEHREGERRSTSSPVGEEDERPTARGQIAELVMYYRDACRAKPLQRDYAFMGRLYNSHPIDRIYDAIDATALQIAAGQHIEDPLRYVAGVLRSPDRHRDSPPRAAPRESAVDRRLRELGVIFSAGA